MESITLLAPAKINLCLKVIGKRPDSYHEIETIFAKLDLSDEISLKIRNDRLITVNSNDQALNNLEISDNLCYKAAKMLFDLKGIRDKGVDIFVKKNIPLASGLGGGSSDAAATLIGINKLFEMGINKDELISISVKLGADVPFFVYDKPYALAKGIGEVLEEINCTKEFWLILLFRPSKKATKDIYNKLNLGLTNQSSNVKITRRNLEQFDLKLLAKSLFNDLESVVIKEDAKIKEALRELSLNTLGARITGSGPTIFGIVENKEVARSLIKRYEACYKRQDDWRFILAKTKVTS